jgi:hypothetical protein
MEVGGRGVGGTIGEGCGVCGYGVEIRTGRRTKTTKDTTLDGPQVVFQTKCRSNQIYLLFFFGSSNLMSKMQRLVLLLVTASTTPSTRTATASIIGGPANRALIRCRRSFYGRPRLFWFEE